MVLAFNVAYFGDALRGVDVLSRDGDLARAFVVALVCGVGNSVVTDGFEGIGIQFGVFAEVFGQGFSR